MNKIKNVLKNIAGKRMSRNILILVAVVGVFLYGYILVRALSVGDDFSTAAYVASYWRTTVDTSAGVAKLATKTCDDAVWYCSLNNIVTDALGDGNFIVVARNDAPGTLTWKTSNASCVAPQCATDGSGTVQLQADNNIKYDEYQARNYCKSIGGRLPTLGELQTIYTNKASFGSFQSSVYWSASENNATNAWSVSLSGGATANYNKTYTNYVRCVLGW